MTGRNQIREAIDRYGPNFDSWRDRALAAEARQAILADRALRAAYDDAVTLWNGLSAARVAADAEVAVSGAVGRIESALTRSRPRPWRSRWIAIAAAMVVAAGLGSAYDLVIGDSGSAAMNVVVLDPLVFGTAEVEQQ